MNVYIRDISDRIGEKYSTESDSDNFGKKNILHYFVYQLLR